MTWQEIRTFCSLGGSQESYNTYTVLHEDDNWITFKYTDTYNNSITGMQCSRFTDDFCEWLIVYALICELTELATSNLYKVLDDYSLMPSGGLTTMGENNDLIFIRKAYPLSSVILPCDSGAVYENSIAQIFYVLASDAQKYSDMLNNRGLFS